jgi:hypothetical protein
MSQALWYTVGDLMIGRRRGDSSPGSGRRLTVSCSSCGRGIMSRGRADSHKEILGAAMLLNPKLCLARMSMLETTQ